MDLHRLQAIQSYWDPISKPKNKRSGQGLGSSGCLVCVRPGFNPQHRRKNQHPCRVSLLFMFKSFYQFLVNSKGKIRCKISQVQCVQGSTRCTLKDFKVSTNRVLNRAWGLSESETITALGLHSTTSLSSKVIGVLFEILKMYLGEVEPDGEH